MILPLCVCSDSYIVRVKAVVMTRDDSSGGWLAQDGGALTRVGVCRLLPPELPPLPSSQFLIRGERLRDKQVNKQPSIQSSNQAHFGGDEGDDAVVARRSGDPGLSAEEGPGLHHSDAHVSPLEGGGQEVRPVLPEPGRRQSVRQGGTESHRGPGRRCASSGSLSFWSDS